MPELVVDDVVVGMLDRYQVFKRIAEGGYGVVFQAQAQSQGHFVALKQMLQKPGVRPEEFAKEVNTFRREADILIALANDPRIVKGYELVEDNGPILVMEHVSGESLEAVLKAYVATHNGRPFPPEMAVPIGIELCSVMDYLHRLPSQIIYRDLKPANILWDAEQGQTRLIDFGTARFSDKTKKVTVALGTWGYAPPELFSQNQEVSFPADVYTIGATLYELLTGKTPYDGAVPVPVNNFYGYRLPDRLQQILLRSLQMRPQDRYQRASDMGAELATVVLGPEQKPVVTARNRYPIFCCFCPLCGSVPRHDKARFCPKCAKPYHAAVLKVISNNPSVSDMQLFINGERATVGRVDPLEKIFPDLDLSRFDEGRYVSRQHAVIERRGPMYYLTHCRTATNSTKVDGVQLTAERPFELPSGARLEFADLIANFETRPVA